jgi:hypothetical protein
MNRGEAKLLAPIIAAFGDGKEIQYKHPVNKEWYSPPAPSFEPKLEWRIKPDTVKHRRYIYRAPSGKYWVGTLHDREFSIRPGDREKTRDFVRWIDKDWQEAEIEA